MFKYFVYSYVKVLLFGLVCLPSWAILYEGDDCDLPYKEPGRCIRLSECPSAIKLIRSRQNPKTCGFIRSTPIVCCPKTQAETTRLADLKCKEFQIPKIQGVLNAGSNPSVQIIPNQPIPSAPPLGYEFKTNSRRLPPVRRRTYNPRSNLRSDLGYNTESCEHTEYKRNVKPVPVRPASNSPMNDQTKFVIGGTKALAREFPHMAALGYTNGNKKLWLCGGSLVSEKYILTAAHCLFSKEYGKLAWARLGDLNLYATTDNADPQDYEVVNLVAHPKYQPPSTYHDIAVAQLNREAIITSYVKPACLYSHDNLNAQIELIATGWGLTSLGGNVSETLQKVDLDLFTEQECDASYKEITGRRLPNGVLHRQQICVGGRSKEKDTCQGDSGGPLQVRVEDKDGERFYIIGITSFGKVCGIVNVPGIYTRVSYYLPWLESILWPSKI